MPDVIQLLPDNIANQIAAGEVIQRPASAVKELMENAIDAGATNIHLIIKDAGKTMIQVNDNGNGMSATDARTSFERHATSKIKSVEDLFSIRTMGFRGEALASIAAVAQVELKTRRQEDETGTRILIENSKVELQEPCASEVGTQLVIRNLFYNVPARRNFLKSDTTELRQIVDEFTRVAMAFPEVKFRFTNNNTEIFHLEAGKLKLRVINLLGQNVNNKLVPVEEVTEFVRIHGYISSPDAATRTRGNQYFFVNNRFIRSAYLNHAVSQAYRELIGKDEFPLFAIFIDIDPKRVDVNVHPTKQEIKFEEDKMIYAIVHAASKHALSKYSIAPSLDFSLDSGIEQLSAVNQPFRKDVQEEVKSDYLFQSFTEKGQAHFLESKNNKQNWRELYKVQDAYSEATKEMQPGQKLGIEEEFQESFLQINNAYIIVTTKNGCLFFDQHLAHARVLYERYEKANSEPISIQKCLVPLTLEYSPVDAIMLESMLDDLLVLGFEIEKFGQHSFLLQGVPADMKSGQEKNSIEQLMEAYKHFSSELKLNKREKILRVLASQRAIPVGKKMDIAEMNALFLQLMQCEQPQISPNGKKVFTQISSGDIATLIKNG